MPIKSIPKRVFARESKSSEVFRERSILGSDSPRRDCEILPHPVDPIYTLLSMSAATYYKSFFSLQILFCKYHTLIQVAYAKYLNRFHFMFLNLIFHKFNTLL